MTIEQRTMELLTSLSGVKAERGDQTLADDLGLDSLNLVLLLLKLEETFGFALEESDMNPLELTSVADVAALVEKYTTRAPTNEKAIPSQERPAADGGKTSAAGSKPRNNDGVRSDGG